MSRYMKLTGDGGEEGVKEGKTIGRLPVEELGDGVYLNPIQTFMHQISWRCTTVDED